LEVAKVTDLRCREDNILTAVGSKQAGSEQLLARLITEACIWTLRESCFNVDNV
jgi:hypothetical protein